MTEIGGVCDINITIKLCPDLEMAQANRDKWPNSESVKNAIAVFVSVDKYCFYRDNDQSVKT